MLNHGDRQEPSVMEQNRSKLDDLLDELERDLAMLIMEGTDQEDLWLVFAGQAEAIEAQASPDDLAHVKLRMNEILAARGIVPSDKQPVT
jgi:hypothetical protein